MAKLKSVFVLFFSLFIISDSARLRSSGRTENEQDTQRFTEGQTDSSTLRGRENKIEDVYLRYYTGKSLSEYKEIRLLNAEELLNQPGFKKEGPTVIYIHGYIESPESESVEVIVRTYLEAQPTTNVVVLDWSNMAQENYIINAAPNTREVGYNTAKQIRTLLKQGLKLDTLHIVGHSLGAHVAGFMGRQLKQLGVTLKRITGLDPAFPMFYPGFILKHIKADDAEFVDIIHTDPGNYGAPITTGSIDFWPNYGSKRQPGCPKGPHKLLSPEDLCSHHRSWRFWAESIVNQTAFPAAGNDKSKVVYMGLNTDVSARGDFYLKTNAEPPFGMGMAGI